MESIWMKGKRCWNSIFLRWPRDHPQRIQPHDLQRDWEGTRTLHTSEDRLNEAKFQCRLLQHTCSDFPSDVMLWIKDLKSSRSVCGKDFPNFEMLDAKSASALNKITQNSQFKKVSLEEQKVQKEDRFLRERHRLRDLRLLSIDWRSWHSIGLRWFFSLSLFMMTILRNLMQDGTKWKVCTTWGHVSLRDSRPYWNCTTEIHQKISMPNYQK